MLKALVQVISEQMRNCGAERQISKDPQILVSIRKYPVRIRLSRSEGFDYFDM
jgi:hypothetical protein